MIYDTKPDYVIDLGDGADMRSLNSYDTRYPKAIVSQSYQSDIEHYNDSQDRLRQPFRQAKKRLPAWYGFEGNHENRIKKAVAADPRLEGSKYGISFSHLNTKDWFDEYHQYENSGPAVRDYDGVSFSHYISSGNYGSAISGLHHAYALLSKRHCSTVVGHSHKRGLYFKDDAHPFPTIGLVVGCFKGKDEGWAGQSNRDWWKGVLILRGVENGWFDPEFISISRLEEAYG
jgi:hypothetical protein